MQAKIYTIPAEFPLAHTLAATLLHHARDDLLSLSDMRIYLPNRRACQLVRDAFLQESNGAATLLPRLIPLGDIDEEDIMDTDPLLLHAAPHLIAPLPTMERHMILTELLLARRDIDLTPAQAYRLATDLALLLDESYLYDVDLSRLSSLVTHDIADHWQKIVSFLEIITQHWPDILAQHGHIDNGAYRVALLKKKSESLYTQPPQGIVLAAGFGMTSPRVQQILERISRLPQGAVLLHGFDPNIHEAFWENCGPSHMFFAAKELLNRVDLEPKAIKTWPLLAHHSDASTRTKFLQYALQPYTHYSLEQCPVIDDLSGIQVIHADTLQHEAQTIALIIREALVTPEKTVLVVSQDTTLNTLLQHRLLRWNIPLGTHVGKPLLQTDLGQFFLLLLSFHDTTRPVSSFLGLIKHPLFLVHDYSSFIQRLDLDLLRKPFDLAKLFSFVPSDSSKEECDFYTHILNALRFTQETSEKTLDEWLTLHIQAAENLSGDANRLWQQEGAETCATQLIALRQTAQAQTLVMTMRGYAAFFKAFFAQSTTSRQEEQHPRVTVTTPQQAPFYRADCVILAGMTEGVWPRQVQPDAWLSPHMRHVLGFPDPLIQHGHESFLFYRLMHCPQVIISWSKERDGAHVLPSPLIQQCMAVLEKNTIQIDTLLHPLQETARVFDRPHALTPRSAPQANPPLALRPRDLPITFLEKAYRDPYFVFVDRVLSLRPLNPFDTPRGAREWGNIIHETLASFLSLPKEQRTEERFVALAQQPLAETALPALQENRWQQELHTIATRLIPLFASSSDILHTEAKGRMTLGTCTILGRADLLITHSDGMSIVDFKTGNIPANKKIIQHHAPQLPLLGALLVHGSFENIQKQALKKLCYIPVKGKLNAVIKEQIVPDPETRVTDAVAHLEKWIDRFYNQTLAYHAQALPKNIHDPIAHFKRVAEWHIDADDDEEEDDEDTVFEHEMAA